VGLGKIHSNTGFIVSPIPLGATPPTPCESFLRGYGGEFDALVDTFNSWSDVLEGLFNMLKGLSVMLEGYI
jgi:hypothetical protein